MCICYVFLYFAANRIQALIAFPGRDINIKEITNHPAGLLVSEKVSYTAPSGNTINGVYVDNWSDRVVYYFHGNGAPLEYFYSDIDYISWLWYTVIAVEYPWYWDATGMPYLDENRDFSNVFYTNMKKTLWFEDKDVIIWWYSVGTALAIDFAKQRDFDSLVLFSPLSSLYDMSAKTFWFPLQKLFFLEESYSSKESIKSIEEPTLIIHGNDDKVVPFQQGRVVYENSAASRKKFIEIDDFGHSLIPERYGEVLTWYIQDFLSPTENSADQKELFLDKDLALQILEKYQNELTIKNLDLTTDESITKYVDPSIPFNEKWYIPENLRALSLDFIIDTKWNAQMREQAAVALELMAEAFYSEFWENMVVVSTYRSYNYQAGIKARWCPDNLCAKAGHSEHQWWLAVDFWSASTQSYWDNSERLTNFYTWLYENAHEYGFHNTYQNGREVDGYDTEPWHWRYVWIDFARYLHENEITFAEHFYRK